MNSVPRWPTSVQDPDAVGYALAAMDATGAAVVQGHCAVRNVHDGILPGEPSCPLSETQQVAGEGQVQARLEAEGQGEGACAASASGCASCF